MQTENYVNRDTLFDDWQPYLETSDVDKESSQEWHLSDSNKKLKTETESSISASSIIVETQRSMKNKLNER